MTDENVNEVENEEKDECCGQGCCDGVDGGGSSGGGGFKGLLFLIVLILAGVVVANSILNKNKAGGCAGGVCPDGTVAANACGADKAAACPATDKAAMADKTAVCPSTTAKADAKASCSSSKPGDGAAACSSMAK